MMLVLPDAVPPGLFGATLLTIDGGLAVALAVAVAATVVAGTLQAWLGRRRAARSSSGARAPLPPSRLAA